MFYSHTFLARKGPLGTVWCAAHLQHKLKKSHYTSTNIPITVERIMHPEVPIALRMSGHLLLGVVRIYSKQVEYFFQDCNVLLIGLRKAYASTCVNLPENAIHATVESITLPDNFQLDALDLDDGFGERFDDNHLKDLEEITLEDQIPVGKDQYIVVSFDEDLRNSPCSRDSSECRPQTMQEDSCPYTPVNAQDPGPSNQGIVELPSYDNNPQSFPEFEIMRDASLHYFPEDVPLWPDQSEDKMEPDLVLMEIMKQKEFDVPASELVSEGSSPPKQCQIQVSAVSEQDPETFDSHGAYGHVSPELAIRSTPRAEQPMEGQRKKRRLYDELTILSNRFMKQLMNDSSCILRTRKECPTDALGIWKSNKRIKKDTIFVEPLTTGLCSDLCDAYKKDFISAKPYIGFGEEACSQVTEVSAPINVNEMEIERLRNYEMPAGNTSLPELVQSPNIVLSSPTRLTPSPTRAHDYTPVFGTGASSYVHPVEMASRITSGLASSSGALGSDKETPMIFSKELPGVENTCPSDTPELRNSTDGELSFLAEEENTPAGLQGTPDYFLRRHSGASEFEALSVRTRSVAQFLKNRLSVTPILESQSEDISLNMILEGKRKKLCARMIFETLVLKNCGLVDLRQENSFGDVTLTVTPKLLKLFSS